MVAVAGRRTEQRQVRVDANSFGGDKLWNKCDWVTHSRTEESLYAAQAQDRGDWKAEHNDSGTRKGRGGR
jgi:hypothetical protein